ncbi:MAG: gamma-glutamyltransferase [Leptolyngbya sp. DLM2.Bin27]|nr:MAG: gamma-glutamyltransferase [Leptolyngbya sp. DLM2.Bin27]
MVLGFQVPTRPPAVGTRGMVASPHQLASAAGLRVLQMGGSAVDAAIALNSTLGVVYPHMTGLGGDSFWLIYDAATGQVHGLNGSGRAAAQATPEYYCDRHYTELPSRGPLAAITVPGTVDAWCTAHDRFGRLPLDKILQAAIDYAEQGYPVSTSQELWTRRNRDLLSQDPWAQSCFLPQQQVPNRGTVLTNGGLGQSLRAIASGGKDEFYRGAIAAEITRHLTERGGILTAADFAAHHSDWVEPIATTYRGYTVVEMPPNTQGFAVLQILNLLEGYDLQAIGHHTADYYHLMVEATKLAFADRDRWLSDPDFVNIPIQELISKAYADRRRPLIDLAQAQPYGPGIGNGDTTFCAVVDDQGNAVATIQSLYFDYGCGVVGGETGIVLQNRGSFFALDPAEANSLAPGKRPFHTLIPALVLNPAGDLEWVLGTMGGEGQPQTQAALLTRAIDFGLDPQSAIDWPRWLQGRTWGESTSRLCLEGRIPEAIQAELARRGHPVAALPDWAEPMGHAQMIHIHPDTGVLWGGADPRGDGTALGW